MVRRYYRRRNVANRDKYSVENTVCVTPPSNTWTQVEETETSQASRQFTYTVVPAVDVQGMRKVKHLTLSFSSQSDHRLLYALVYVPQGYEPNFINVPLAGQPGSLYEPNQMVMSSGTLDFSGGPLRIRTPLSRNLNSGDAIYLVLANYESTGSSISVNTTYAITLQ